jgi:hypothetical protein
MNAAALTGCLVVVACAAPARVEVGVDAGEPGVGSACVGTWSYHDGLAVLTIGADSGYHLDYPEPITDEIGRASGCDGDRTALRIDSERGAALPAFHLASIYVDDAHFAFQVFRPVGATAGFVGTWHMNAVVGEVTATGDHLTSVISGALELRADGRYSLACGSPSFCDDAPPVQTGTYAVGPEAITFHFDTTTYSALLLPDGSFTTGVVFDRVTAPTSL